MTLCSRSLCGSVLFCPGSSSFSSDGTTVDLLRRRFPWYIKTEIREQWKTKNHKKKQKKSRIKTNNVLQDRARWANSKITFFFFYYTCDPPPPTDVRTHSTTRTDYAQVATDIPRSAVKHTVLLFFTRSLLHRHQSPHGKYRPHSRSGPLAALPSTIPPRVRRTNASVRGQTTKSFTHNYTSPHGHTRI